MSMGSGDNLRVLYVAGLPRSGSTVLGYVLGKLPGTVFVGELAFFWRRFAEDELCSCRMPLSGCPFWSAVVGKAFGELTLEQARALDKLEQRAIRTLRVLGLIPVRWSTRWAKSIRVMLEERGRLYRSICEVANATCIADSGKEVTFGCVTARLSNTSFRTVHLVRDPRGVAFSWQKQVPSDSEPRDMPRSSAVKTAVRWMSNNLLVHFSLRRLSSGYSRIRYEDLVVHPDETARLIPCAKANAATSYPHVSQSAGHAIEHHLVGSNPGVRQKLGGNLKLTLDEEWRAGLPPIQQLLVTVVCWSLMAAYHYPLGIRRRLSWNCVS
jgi:hypothetical protein